MTWLERDAFGLGFAVEHFAELPSRPSRTASRIFSQHSSTYSRFRYTSHLPPLAVWAGYLPRSRYAEIQYVAVTSDGIRLSAPWERADGWLDCQEARTRAASRFALSS